MTSRVARRLIVLKVLLEVRSLEVQFAVFTLEIELFKSFESKQRQVNESSLLTANRALFFFRQLLEAVFAATEAADLAELVSLSSASVQDLEADSTRKVTFELI